MMRNKERLIAVAAAAAMAIGMTACGSTNTAGAADTTSAAAAETAASAATADAATADTEATTDATETDAADAEAEPAAGDAAADAAGDTVTYESDEGWKIRYDPETFYMSEQPDGVQFSYQGESAGSNVVVISYVKDKMPNEVLYDNIKDADDSLVTRYEGWFGTNPEDWSYSASVDPGTVGSGLGTDYTAVEHNGGTLLIEVISHRYPDSDWEKQQPIDDAISGLIDSLEFTNHEPQQQYSYVPGTYETTVTEEIEGKEETYTYSLVLNADHTGTMFEQDMIGCYWTTTEIVDDDDNHYEYTIEGDTLLLNRFDDVWDTYNKVSDETAETSAALAKSYENIGSDSIVSKAAGTYTDENKDELVITKDGDVTVDITRLTHMEGNVSGFGDDDDTLLLTVKDANDGDMELSFNTKTKVLTVENSTWSLLENGTTFTLDK